MEQIKDAPWIEETMRTGHCKYGFWNTRPGAYNEDEYEEDDWYEEEYERGD